jgi:hypothetical protein
MPRGGGRRVFRPESILYTVWTKMYPFTALNGSPAR